MSRTSRSIGSIPLRTPTMPVRLQNSKSILAFCTRVRLGQQIEVTTGLPLEFTFATVELRLTCESRRKALAILGETGARALSQRLADMTACGSAAEFFGLFPDDVSPSSSGEFLLRLPDGWILTFRTAHLRTPVTPDDVTDWQRVTRIMFVTLDKQNG